jgi:hypothetical protein
MLGICEDNSHVAPTANATETKRKLPHSRTLLLSPPNSAVRPPKASVPTAAKPATAPRKKENTSGGLGRA